MWHNRKPRLKHCLRITIFLFFCSGVVGCGHHGKHADVESKNKELQTALTAQQKKIEQLEKDNTGLKIQTLEYESLIKDLQDRTHIQQQRLDAAIVEVVRSKARLRSLESKAESASTIAEAEISVGGLKKQVAANDTNAHEEIAKADQLLTMSATEFKAGNFGGALYLASEAKRQARTLQLRLSSTKTETFAGETLFSQPLPLKCIKNSNLRIGPGLEHAIVVTLAKGTFVLGHAYLESWVHVETKDGKYGWIHQSLIGAR